MCTGAYLDRAESATGNLKRRGGTRRGMPPRLLAGRFEPSAEAMLVSPALLFQRATPVTARFRRLSGDSFPARSFAVELLLRFQSRECDAELRTCSGSVGQSSSGGERGPPVSYATLRYDGPDIYSLGPELPAPVMLRFHLAPQAGEHRFGIASVGGLSPDHLDREMRARIALRPVLFNWYAEVVREPSGSGPSAQCSASGPARIHLGVIHLDQLLERDWPDGDHARPPADLTIISTDHRGHPPGAAPLEPGETA